MLWVRRVMASFLGLLLVALLFPTLLVASLYATLLSPSFLKAALRKADVYNFVVAQALPDLLGERWSGLRPAGMALPLTSQEATRLLQGVFPASWLQAQVEGALDAVVPYLAGRQKGFSFSVALQGPKDRLSQQLLVLLEQKSNALPECTIPQLLELQRSPDPEVFLKCRVPGVSFQQAIELTGFLPEFRRALDDALPQELTIADGDLVEQAPAIEQVRERLAALPLALAALGALLALLLLGTALLGGRGLWGKIVWGGAVLALASLASLLALWWLPVQVRPLLPGFPVPAGASTEMVTKGRELGLLLLEGALAPARTWALLLLGSGALALALGLLLPKYRLKKRPSAPLESRLPPTP